MEPDSPPRARRSSILKVARPAPARSPLQSLEANQDAQDEDRTTVTRSFKRRVSFSRTNKVQEFCLEAPQTWGEAYEKELSPEAPVPYKGTIPFEPSGSLQDLLSSEIKSAPQFIQSYSSSTSSTTEVFRMSYQVSQTVNGQLHPQICPATVTTAEIMSNDGSDDDMDITAPNIAPPFTSGPQVKPIMDIDKENLVAKLMPDFMKNSLPEKTSSSAMDTLAENIGMHSHRPLSLGAFPNVYLEPDDYENSPGRPIYPQSVLDKTRIEDSSMEMSNCITEDTTNTGINMNRTFGNANVDLLNKSLKSLNQTVNDACNMDITEHVTKTSMANNLNLNSSSIDMTGVVSSKIGLQKNLNEILPLAPEISKNNTSNVMNSSGLLPSLNTSAVPINSTASLRMCDMETTKSMGTSFNLSQSKIGSNSFNLKDNSLQSSEMSYRLENHSDKSSLNSILTGCIINPPQTAMNTCNSSNTSLKLSTSNVLPQNLYHANKSLNDVQESNASENTSLCQASKDPSMLDVTKVQSPNKNSKMGDEYDVGLDDTHKSESEKSNITKSNESLQNMLYEKSMMDITRTVSPNEVEQKTIEEKFIKDKVEVVASKDTTLGEKSIVDGTTEPGTLLQKTLGEKSVMDLTQPIDLVEMQHKPPGIVSIMDITKTVDSEEILQKSIGEKSIIDITRTGNESHIETLQISNSDKSMMNMTRTISPADLLQKSVYEKSMMDITRTVSSEEMLHKSNTSKLQVSMNINETVTKETGEEKAEPNQMLSTELITRPLPTIISQQKQEQFNDSIDMDITESADNFKVSLLMDKIWNTPEEIVVESEVMKTTESTVTQMSGPTIDKFVNHEKINICDKVANEKCEIESYKIIENRRNTASPVPESELQVDKFYITEDIEDVHINETTGELSRKVKHLELTEAIESRVHIDTTEPESQGTKIELNSRQELYLSPVMADRQIDVATVITRPSTASPVLPKKILFNENSPLKKTLGDELMDASLDDGNDKGKLKRHSTSFEDEVTSNKKNCQQTIESTDVPEIIVTESTPTETVIFKMPEVEPEQVVTVVADIPGILETDVLSSSSDMDVDILCSTANHEIEELVQENGPEKRQLENQNHPEYQQVKKICTRENQEIEIETEHAPLSEPIAPPTIKEQLVQNIKRMQHVWHVQSADEHELQLTTLRGAALLTLKLHHDGEVSEAYFAYNPAGIAKKQKGPRVALHFCYTLLELRCNPEHLRDLCELHSNPLDLLKQLYQLLKDLTTLAIGLERAATTYVLEFTGTRVKFSARSLQLLLRINISVDFAKWDDIKMKDVAVSVTHGNIRSLDIVELVPTISRNSDFLPKFIEVVREYVETLEQCGRNFSNHSMLH